VLACLLMQWLVNGRKCPVAPVSAIPSDVLSVCVSVGVESNV